MPCSLFYVPSYDEVISGIQSTAFIKKTMYISDMNLLYEAFLASGRGSSWKKEVQLFEYDWLYRTSILQEELETMKYKTSPTREFNQNERGKIRHISANIIDDRIVRHSLCDNVINPSLKPYIIPNNSASQKGKGLKYARDRFEKDLHNYCLKNNGNNGYVVFLDMSKYYDNIRHDNTKLEFYPIIPKENHWLLDDFLKSMEVDVSYMTKKEYRNCLNIKFDSVWYYDNIPKSLHKKEKFMQKSMNIGDQFAQDVGIFALHKLDNYAKIVLGLKYYGRYMDDIYFIAKTKEEAETILKMLIDKITELDMFVNYDKTKIVSMSERFSFLQLNYKVSETGKVYKWIKSKTVHRERRKLRKYKKKYEEGKMTLEQIYQAYNSWMGSYVKYMSKKQIKSMKALFNELFGKELYKNEANKIQ